MTIARTLILCLLGASLSPAIAQEQNQGWPCELSDGSCIGRVYLDISQAEWPDAEGKFEITHFSNGEWLFLNHSRDTPTKILQIRDVHRIYHGLDSAEEEEHELLVFQHRVGRVLFSALVLVFMGQPNGPHSMPADWTTAQLALDGAPVLVSVRKTSPESFDFRVSSAPDLELTGSWSMEQAAPWPDEYSLAGWTNQRQVPFATLGDLRASIRQSWKR